MDAPPAAHANSEPLMFSTSFSAAERQTSSNIGVRRPGLALCPHRAAIRSGTDRQCDLKLMIDSKGVCGRPTVSVRSASKISSRVAFVRLRAGQGNPTGRAGDRERPPIIRSHLSRREASCSYYQRLHRQFEVTITGGGLLFEEPADRPERDFPLGERAYDRP